MIYAGLIAFFFLEYIRPTSYIPALLSLHLNSIVPLATVAMSMITAGPVTLARMASEPNVRVVCAMLALIWMSFLTADVQQLSWNTLSVVLGFAFMTWVLGCEVTTTRKLKGVIVALIAAHLLVAALNPLLFTDPETRHYVTSGSFLGDGNDFALSIDIILPLCLFLLLDAGKKIVKLFWAAAILVLVAGVVVTQSRGGTVGLVFMGLYYWTKSQKKVQTGLLVVVVLTLVLALAPGNYFNRMRMISDTTEGSASARLTAWRTAIRMAVDSPVLGVGAGHFGTKIGNEYRPADFVGSGMTAHSIYFLALGELGLPGLSLLLFFVISNLRANHRLADAVRERAPPGHLADLQLLASLSAALIAFASAGAFLSALYYPHFYILGGLLIAGRNVVRQRLAAEPAGAMVAATPADGGREVSLHWALRPPPRRTLTNGAGARPRLTPGAATRNQGGR